MARAENIPDNRNTKLLEFKKRINEMRSDIRLNDEDAEEQDEHDDLLVTV